MWASQILVGIEAIMHYALSTATGTTATLGLACYDRTGAFIADTPFVDPVTGGSLTWTAGGASHMQRGFKSQSTFPGNTCYVAIYAQLVVASGSGTLDVDNFRFDEAGGYLFPRTIYGSGATGSGDLGPSIDFETNQIIETAANIDMVGTVSATDPAFLGQQGITADSSVGVTTTETVLASFTMPADSHVLGRVYSVYMRGRTTNTLGAASVQLKIRLNGVIGIQVVGMTMTIPTGIGSTMWFAQLDYTVRLLGSGGKIQPFMFGQVGSTNAVPANVTTTVNMDTTVSNTIDVTATWSVANAGNLFDLMEAWLGQSR
jgi:hypothetical protein